MVPLFSAIVATCLSQEFASAAEQSLAGQWTIRLDSKKAGIDGKWFAGELPKGTAEEYGQGRLPGSTDENKLGTPNHRPANLAWLSRVVEYCGPAWYQREIEIPAEWKNKRITLHLERCHWETQVWLDDRFCGMNDSMSTAHVHELGVDLAPGKHRLTLRVDNTIKYDLGPDAHSTSEHTQTNWNGVVGRIELCATDPVWIEDVHVYPDLDKKTARVVVKIGNATARPLEANVDLQAALADAKTSQPRAATIKSRLNAKKMTAVEITLPMGDDVRAWDEFSPSLYTLTTSIATDGFKDRRQINFGMRKLVVENKRFMLNGRKIYLRGTLDCCIYPKTGYPPTDVASWLRVMQICRSYGLNHIRFHSWCPPEAAFVAADQMGFILQPELPVWVQNWGRIQKRDEYVEGELKRILDAYGNHPSFGLMSMGNEPGGDFKVLWRYVDIAKKYDGRRLYAGASGWGGGPNDDYLVTPNGRGVRGQATTYDMSKAFATQPRPVVSHEIGQWTFYPNMEEIKKYDGVLRARNFELVRDDLRKKGLLDQAADFTRASGLWSVQLYKEEIEIMLRTPRHGGFQLLDLHDFPGQGTALVGLLDPFWDSKGLIEPAAFRRFCGPTVPLARMPKRTFTTGETLTANIAIAHFGPADLKKVSVSWSLRDSEDREVAMGGFAATRDIPTGDLTEIGEVCVPLDKVAAPGQYKFVVGVNHKTIANDWNIWVYPKTVNTDPGEVLVATKFDATTKAALAAGRSVLLMPSRSAFELTKTFNPTFYTVFWSPVWFKGNSTATMGVLCDPKHAALAQFPTEMHSNWQWQEPVANSFVMVLNDFPHEFRPIVQVVDNFTKNNRLGLVFEARVGPGRLLVTTIDLQKDLANRPVSRQLLASLLSYMQGNAFQPKTAIDPEMLSKFMASENRSVLKEIGAKVVYFDSEAKQYPAANAIDGNLDTIWHTPFGPGATKLPHEMQIDMQKPVKLSGLKYFSRFEGPGCVSDYEVFLSDDGKEWGKPVAKGKLQNMPQWQPITFAEPRQSRYIRFVARSSYAHEQFIAVAELDAILAEK